MAGSSQLPRSFAARMAGWLGPEFPAFEAALTAYRAGLRVNTLKVTPEEFRSRSPFALASVPWCPEGFVFTDSGARPGAHPFYYAGLYYPQDLATMAAALLLDPRPGEWVLDLCAAPGGKASHLAARMGNTGCLVANEIQPRRASVLAWNLERMGVTNALITNESPQRLAARWAGWFDRVLIDAPCSGEALLVRNPGAARYWSPETVIRCARRELAVLEEGARLVRPGGRLLYATCSFSPEENEGVVHRFLRHHREFELVEPPPALRFDRGHPEWLPDGAGELERAVRLWPQRGEGHGHFYALLRRREGPAPRRKPAPLPPLSPEARDRYLEFCREYLRELPVPEEEVVEQGNELFRPPLSPKAWEGLRVLRPGWWLGRVRKGRFEPNHALAVALDPGRARQVHDFAPEDRALRSYLRGEALEARTPPGWVLVTVGGFSLGWARGEEGRLRSLYPYHLRATMRELWASERARGGP
ncbi:MAG: RsmB/NOP family class I SAM-dependent RNA methyltransferase [Clostridia bacterium]|jgi:NOL1/NOP2/sun family putative RNA methylase|nr:RsmB/NOP family class I SAM-dependent RNA methyltransferase [Clostridia bacterium]